MSSIVRSVTTQVNRSGCQQANPGQAIGGHPQRPRMQPGRPRPAERNKRIRTTSVVGTPYSRLKPACACRRCRARRAKRTPQRWSQHSLRLASPQQPVGRSDHGVALRVQASYCSCCCSSQEWERSGTSAHWPHSSSGQWLSSPLCQHAWIARPHW